MCLAEDAEGLRGLAPTLLYLFCGDRPPVSLLFEAARNGDKF